MVKVNNPRKERSVHGLSVNSEKKKNQDFTLNSYQSDFTSHLKRNWCTAWASTPNDKSIFQCKPVHRFDRTGKRNLKTERSGGGDFNSIRSEGLDNY